jgi:GTP cyclohydrolase II
MFGFARGKQGKVMANQPPNPESLAMPATREPASLLSVDRAISELRRGRIIAMQGGDGHALLATAAEGITDTKLNELNRLGKNQPMLALTSRRATVLGFAHPKGKVVTVNTGAQFNAQTIQELCDPLANCDVSALDIKTNETSAYDSARSAVLLTKLARLLPAAVCVTLTSDSSVDLHAWCARRDMMIVDAGDVFQYENVAARSLTAVSEARVPLEEAENCRIIAYRPVDGGLEHLAIVIGKPKESEPVLMRLHSECFTGDLLGSLRCDCGDQLRGAITEISSRGSGILLYLAQEGRGIGLVNKLRAYTLQDRGFDTLDANEQLGFDADERIYMPAARMLNLLGFNKVRLMTNNPIKVEALQACGVDVVERVQHSFPSNEHNEIYLETKKSKSGHHL